MIIFEVVVFPSPTADAVMNIASEMWPELEGKLVGVADQREMIEMISNYSHSDQPLCTGGAAGGTDMILILRALAFSHRNTAILCMVIRI